MDCKVAPEKLTGEVNFSPIKKKRGKRPGLT